MKEGNNKANNCICNEDWDDYPILHFTQGKKKYYGPKTVGEIEDREWYELEIAYLSGEMPDPDQDILDYMEEEDRK